MESRKQKVAGVIFAGLACLAFGAAFAWMILNMASGCGALDAPADACLWPYT